MLTFKPSSNERIFQMASDETDPKSSKKFMDAPAETDLPKRRDRLESLMARRESLADEQDEAPAAAPVPPPGGQRQGMAGGGMGGNMGGGRMGGGRMGGPMAGGRMNGMGGGMGNSGGMGGGLAVANPA
jgi:hypothetical protein